MKLTKKQKALRKAWDANVKRWNAMSIGGPKVLPSKMAKPKPLDAGIMAVLNLHADRLASKGEGIGYNGKAN